MINFARFSVSLTLIFYSMIAFSQTQANGYFVEAGGLVVIEAESIATFPDSWKSAASSTAPNLDLSSGPAIGGDFLSWEGAQSTSNTGVSTLIYPVQINTPGVYRFHWRSQIGNGTNVTEHNDTWVKIESDEFWGEKNGGSIVCPKGMNAAENECSGGVPAGGGEKGWFKVYSSGANSWNWSARTSDNDGHIVFARFDQAGIYDVMLSARSSFHIIDRMVLSHEAYSGNAESTTLPQSQFVSEGPGVGDKLVVDSSGHWFERQTSKTPVFMAGVGGPEGFLFETNARKQEIVDSLIAQGVNALYFHSIRSFEGDGYNFEDPYVTHEDVTSEVDSEVLDNWRVYLDQLDANDIISWFHIIDDTARPWGCSVPLSSDAKRYISTIVNRFKDMDNLVWLSGEEYLMGNCSDAQDRTLMRAIAAEIRQHDPVHPIGVHHNNGRPMEFDEPDEPVINVFAQQICGNEDHRSPDGMHDAAERGDWVYVMSECHPWHMNLLHDNDRRMIRLSNWATAMAGGYVLLYNAFECRETGKLCSLNSGGSPIAANDPHDPSDAILADLRRLREFMEASRFSELEPDDARASAATNWVMGNDTAGAWIAYSNESPASMGITDLGNVHVRLHWFNPSTGAEVVQNASSSDSPFAVPGSLREDVALFIERTSILPDSPPVAKNDSYSTQPGVALTVSAGNGVLANDSDPNEDLLEAVSGIDINNGSLQLNSNGGFTYTPNPGFEGTATFTYHAWDGALQSTPATVNISVSTSAIGLALIDSSTDQPVQSLLDQSVLSIADLGISNWSVSTSAVPVGTTSIVFSLSGKQSTNRAESVAPYALFGDTNGDYDGNALQAGDYTLSVKAYQGAGANGALLDSLTIRFSMVLHSTANPPIFQSGFEQP